MEVFALTLSHVTINNYSHMINVTNDELCVINKKLHITNGSQGIRVGQIRNWGVIDYANVLINNSWVINLSYIGSNFSLSAINSACMNRTTCCQLWMIYEFLLVIKYEYVRLFIWIIFVVFINYIWHDFRFMWNIIINCAEEITYKTPQRSVLLSIAHIAT